MTNNTYEVTEFGSDDVVSVELDMDRKCVAFSLNGVPLPPSCDQRPPLRRRNIPEEVAGPSA